MSLQTPTFTITLTNERISGSLNGTNQNVLLGAPAGIQATVSPAGLPGSFTWVLTGPFTNDFSSTDNSYKSFYWTEPGNKVITVSYAGAQASFNVAVQVPTLISFQGTLGRNVVNRGSNCSGTFSTQYAASGASYSLECYQNPNQRVGMLWTATATIPNVQYMSYVGVAGIQFRQIVSVYRKRMNNGRIECFTRRNPQTDPNTGWHIDGVDPYRDEVPYFYMGNSITAPYPAPVEFDAPAVPLAGQRSDGTAFEYDSVLADDRFEIYVNYFVGSVGSPTFRRGLHIPTTGCPADRFDCGVDRLVWNWGGTVTFDSTVPNVLYREILSTTPTGQILPSLTTSPRPFDPAPIQGFGYSLCEGAPDTRNPIDGTRFFVRQHYLDFLGREPDQDGWNHWTHEITKCAFDLNCLRFERNHIGHAFFLVANSVVQDPALANPPGTPGFDAPTYNRAFVRHCYLNYLRREPDAEGWDHWTNELNSDGNYWHILDAFQLAPEYRNRFCTGTGC